MYVVELDWHTDAPGETVVLTCNTAEEDGITWTSDRKSDILGSGKTLTIQVKEFEDAGGYTCHKGGEVLSRSQLLLHKKEDEIWSTDILKEQKGNFITLDSEIFISLSSKQYKSLDFFSFQILGSNGKTFLKCEARSYSGRFTCWWLTAFGTDVKFSVKGSRG